jgi:hypothetical protein
MNNSERGWIQFEDAPFGGRSRESVRASALRASSSALTTPTSKLRLNSYDSVYRRKETQGERDYQLAS